MNVRLIVGLLVVGVGLSVATAVSAAEDSTLADAAEEGRAAQVRTLLDSGADVNGTQVDGMTALHWAVYHDDSVTASLLMQSGADVGAANRYGVTPISLAATNRNADVVRLLLDAGADANATLSGGETVLMTAARAGSAEAVTALLAGGGDPNARERRDQTALMWAAAEGHASVVDVLIGAGADVHNSLKSGFTPLFFAVRGGHLEAVRTLLEAGVGVNEVLQRVKEGPEAFLNSVSKRPVDDGTSPLLLAVRNGHFELAVALIEAGADPNDQRTGFNPLHTVTWVRKPDASDLGDPPPIGLGSLASLDFAKRLVEFGCGRQRPAAGDEAPSPPHRLSDRDGRGHGLSHGGGPRGYRDDACPARSGCGPLSDKSEGHDPADGGGRSRHRVASRRGGHRTRGARSRAVSPRAGGGPQRRGQERRHRDAWCGLRTLSEGRGAVGRERGRPGSVVGSEREGTDATVHR